MPDVLPNNPYARPINATKPEGQMLQSEYYGKRSGDKTLSHETRGRQVSPANRFASKVIAVPVDMDALTGTAPKRKRKAATPNPEPTTPSLDVTSPSDEQPVITEDDLFG